jgi:hypothetical protein
MSHFLALKGVLVHACGSKELPVHVLQSTHFQPVGVVVTAFTRPSYNSLTLRTVIVYLPFSSLKTFILI